MAGPATLYQAGDHASRPASGSGCVLYSCTDHDLVYRDDGSSWTTFMTLVGGSGGDIATDAIWDAAGDLAVGSGANTAARLAAGSDGDVLTIASGVPSWEAAGGAASYTSWTPALTSTGSNPDLGTGANAQGRYFQDNKFVHGYGSINFGSSPNAGSGTYRLSLPVTARTPSNFDMNFLGHGYIYDDNAGIVRNVFLTYVTSTTAQLWVTDGSSAVTSSSPWTWAQADAIIVNLSYEAA